jgi:hypothetical protein
MAAQHYLEASEGGEGNQSRGMERKREYICDWLHEVTQAAIENMSPEDVEFAFKTAVISEDAHEKAHKGSPDALVRFMKDAFPKVTGRVKSNLIEPGKPYYGPVKDYEETHSTGEVAKLLDCGLNTVKNRIKKLKLVGYRHSDKDDYRLPQWQFFGESVVDGVDLVLHKLGENGIPAIRKMTLPLAEFNDESIIDVLRQGERDLALKMAESLRD